MSAVPCSAIKARDRHKPRWGLPKVLVSSREKSLLFLDPAWLNIAPAAFFCTKVTSGVMP
jgi:hypothetical protein